MVFQAYYLYIFFFRLICCAMQLYWILRKRIYACLFFTYVLCMDFTEVSAGNDVHGID